MFDRHPQNPIIRPGGFSWRKAVTFNPGVILENGRFYLYERTAGSLRPFHCYIGMQVSDDGIQFRSVSDKPVITPKMLGSEYGSVQDPRVVKIDNTFFMTYAFRPFAWNSYPTGRGVPESKEVQYPGFHGDSLKNQTRSGIARSEDLHKWEHLYWTNSPDTDDRDVILFPEKIKGRYALLRRPLNFVSPSQLEGEAAIRISYSEDLLQWTEAEIVIRPEYPWEGGRIGGATPPLKTDKGWLVFYHGVENADPDHRTVIYRLGVMLLDLESPQKVIARHPNFIMEPEAYYEKTGLYIPNVIFPTGAVLKENKVWLYYGVCDTAIALATAPLDRLLDKLLNNN